MIKVIFFDVGNVIWKDGYTKGIKEYEKKNNIPKNKLYQAAHNGHWKKFTLGKLSEKEYWQKTKLNFNDKLDTYQLRITIFKNFIYYSEVANFIKKIKSKVKTGIISNHPKEWFKRAEKKFGLKKIFDFIIVSGFVHFRKPNLNIFKIALKKTRVKGKEVIYIDDRPERVSGAKKLGIKVVIFKNLTQLKKDLNKLIKIN